MVKYAHESFVSPASASALCATADKESAEDAERDANERAERDY